MGILGPSNLLKRYNYNPWVFDILFKAQQLANVFSVKHSGNVIRCLHGVDIIIFIICITMNKRT